MGEVTEAEFDNWVSYVNAEVDELFGERVYVYSHPLGAGAPADTLALGPDATGERAERMHDILRDLWERWCAAGGAS
jgi:hypothetical protein